MAQTGRRNWPVLYYNAARTTPSQREPLGVGRPSLAHSLCPHAPLMREKVGTRSSELISDQDVSEDYCQGDCRIVCDRKTTKPMDESDRR